MTYRQWLIELYDHPPEIDPVVFEHSTAFYEVPAPQAFDFVDRMLVDPEVHALFSKAQIGNGIHTVYSNCCSELPFLYTTQCDETRRTSGISNLVHLYENFFERYCTANLKHVGDYEADGPLGFICYMLWDVFVLYPGNATPRMIDAALNVMQSALESRNESCLASAIHGLGHWALEVPEAVSVLQHWLAKPTTDNPQLLDYARTATSGRIL